MRHRVLAVISFARNFVVESLEYTAYREKTNLLFPLKVGSVITGLLYEFGQLLVALVLELLCYLPPSLLWDNLVGDMLAHLKQLADEQHELVEVGAVSH